MHQRPRSPNRPYSTWTLQRLADYPAAHKYVLEDIAPMLKLRPRSWELLTYGLLVACLVIMVGTFRSYGIGWDEPFQVIYGDHAIRWYTSGFTDKGALEYKDLMYYGSLFDIVAQLSTRLSPLGVYETRHLINALFGLLGLWGAAKLGRALQGPATGFFAVLFLALTPVYWGSSFFDPKDIPFAALFTVTLSCLSRWMTELPKPRLATNLRLGLALGLTLAVRIGGILLVAYAILAVLLWLMSRYLERAMSRGEQISFWPTLPRVGINLMGVCVLAYVVMLIWWPYAQADPLRNPARALEVMMRFPQEFTMLFGGRQVSSLHLPWDYLFKWFLISMPEFLLLALAVGLPLGGMAVIRVVRARHTPERSGTYGLLLISLLLPVSLVVFGRTPVYDGLRHVLFLLPIVAVLAAASLTSLVERSPSKWLTWGIGTVIAVSLITTAVDCIQLHPYESLHINRVFGGGLAQAYKKYETDYWGISLREGAIWLVGNYPQPADGRKVSVASCGGPGSASYYLPPDRFEFLGPPEALAGAVPDVFLGLPRWGCDQLLSGAILHTVMRQGAPLLFIKQIGSPPEVSSSLSR